MMTPETTSCFDTAFDAAALLAHALRRRQHVEAEGHVMKLRNSVMAIVCVSGALALPAYASPVTPYIGSQGNVAFYSSSTDNQVGSSACFSYSSAGSTVGCSGSTTTPTTGATLNYLTTATADYGVLKAGGTSSITGASGIANTTDYSSSYGQAYFADSWTITGGTGTGTLELQFALDGTYDFSQIGAGLVAGFSLVNLDNYSYSNGTPAFLSGSGSISNTVLLTTTFTFGTPVDFLVSLTAGSNLYNLGGNISSSLDLSETARMNAIIVKDASGNVVPFDLSTGSDAALFQDLAPGIPTSTVPEPPSLALFASMLALLGLLFGARARKSSKRV
jgi:hypothetical protein